jgi:polyferredoxin
MIGANIYTAIDSPPIFWKVDFSTSNLSSLNLVCTIWVIEMVLTKTEVFSRVCGYLRPVSNWNDSKQAEFLDRTVFDKVTPDLYK